MIQKHPITEEKALSKLAALCARAEYCTYDMEEKMKKWGLGPDAIAHNIQYLTGHKYVDNARYCEAFANDKITYNHWGRRKIEQGLWQKHVPEDIYRPVLDAIPEERYAEVLVPLLKAKWPTIKAGTDYERSMKLIKFALGRGFEMELIRKCIEKSGTELNDM